MGFWQALGFKSATSRPFEDVIASLDERYNGNHAGVSATTALQVATVFACVRVIADGCATPNLNVFEENQDGNRRLARKEPEYRMLSRRANEWQTSFEFRRTMTMHAALVGDAFALKIKVNGRVKELIPLVPGTVTIENNSRYDVRYACHDKFGYIGTFTADDVFHLPNIQWNGISGIDALKAARSAVGLAINAEESQSKLHKNGGRPSGFLSRPGPMSPADAERLAKSWKEFTAAGRGGTAILDNDAKYIPLTMTGVDAQHLETRRHQIEEICRAFGVLPIMIGHSDKTATYASSEAFFAAHLKHTLAPWHQSWIQRLDEFVLDGDGPLFAEFDTRYLTAGSMKDRAAWARTMAEMGIYSRNELRDEEGKDPIAGLDQPLTPLNMTTTNSVDEEADNAPDNV